MVRRKRCFSAAHFFKHVMASLSMFRNNLLRWSLPVVGPDLREDLWCESLVELIDYEANEIRRIGCTEAFRGSECPPHSSGCDRIKDLLWGCREPEK